MSEKDGGAAFACASENGHQPGMSLLDYFAGQALAGMELLADGYYSQGEHERGEPAADARRYADAAYRIADAMLATRSRTGGE